MAMAMEMKVVLCNAIDSCTKFGTYPTILCYIVYRSIATLLTTNAFLFILDKLNDVRRNSYV